MVDIGCLKARATVEMLISISTHEENLKITIAVLADISRSNGQEDLRIISSHMKRIRVDRTLVTACSVSKDLANSTRIHGLMGLLFFYLTSIELSTGCPFQILFWMAKVCHKHAYGATT